MQPLVVKATAVSESPLINPDISSRWFATCYMCTPLFWWLPTVNNRFRAKVYLGDLSSVFRAAYDSMSGDGRAVLAFSTEAPPRSGSANEHEGTLAEAGVFLGGY